MQNSGLAIIAPIIMNQLYHEWIDPTTKKSSGSSESFI